MKYFPKIGFYAGLILFVSCQASSSSNNDDDNLDEKVAQNTDSTLNRDEKYAFENLLIEFDEAIVFNSTNNIAIPLIYDEVERDKLDYERTFFNLAIITDTSSTPIMAFPHPIVIKDVLTIEPDAKIDAHYHNDYYDEGDDQYASTEQNEVYNGLIFLETNESYSDDDQHYQDLWVYNLKDLSLRQLNPNATQVIDWDAIGFSGKILVHYLTDSDQDGLFNEEKDDHNMCIYDVTDQSNSGTLFDLQFLKEMKSQVVKSH